MEYTSCNGCIFQWDCADDDHNDWGGCKDWTDNEKDRFESPKENSYC